MPINVLIVNDSLTTVHLLNKIVSSDSRYSVCGVANNGEEGVALAKKLNPDVVLMDINMPVMAGPESIKRIMKENPTPILVVTFSIRIHLTKVYDCLNYGALEVMKTPSHEKDDKRLLDRIAVVSRLKDIVQSKSKELLAQLGEHKEILDKHSISKVIAKNLIVIGASTGGPNIVLTILKSLPKDINAAIVVIQHIDTEFVSGYAEWLDTHIKIKTEMVNRGIPLFEGYLYIPTKEEHLIVGANQNLKFKVEDREHLIVPSINELFLSAAQQYKKNVCGVLLTGMGNDGAIGLKAIKDHGGETIIQDEETSLIYGMPKEAKQLGAENFELPTQDIAPAILNWLKKKET